MMAQVLKQGEIFSGSQQLAEILKKAGCEALHLAENPEIPQGRDPMDAMPASTEFNCGNVYLIMPIPQPGLTRSQEVARWGDDTSLVPVTFITIDRSDTRVQDIAGSAAPADDGSSEKKRYISIMVILFTDKGAFISPSESFEEGYFIAYTDLLEIMKTVRVMPEAEYRETRYGKLYEDMIAARK